MTDGKKFALLVPFMGLGGADKAGLDALKIMRDAGCACTTISTNSRAMGNTWKVEFQKLSQSVHDIGERTKARSRRGVDPLIQALEREQPDMILINNAVMAYEKLPLIRQTLPNARIVCLFHMILNVWPFERFLAKYPDAWDLTIVTSNDLFNSLVRADLPQEKLELIYSAAYHPGERLSEDDARAWRNRVRENLNIGTRRAVLFGMRFHCQKRPGMIVRIAKQLDPDQFAFICAGDGDLMGKTRHDCALGAPQHDFRWLGAVQWPDMQKLYHACDAMVLPSMAEGLPLACFEAMECGCPIVASRVGGTAELVTEDCGVTIPLGQGDDEEASHYASALSELVSEPAIWRQRVEAGRAAMCTRFSWEQHARLMQAAIAGSKRHKHVSPAAIFR